MTADDVDRSLPEARDAEEALLGACLLSVDAFRDAERFVSASDFQVPSHQMIFDAIGSLFAAGEPVDVVTVADVLTRHEQLERIGGPARLVALQGAPAAISSAGRYARIVAERSTLRRFITEASALVEEAYGVPDDVAGLLDRAQALFDQVELPTVEARGLWGVREFLDRPEAERRPWVIPGLLRAGWRALVVAGEGVGKSELLRSMAMATSRGRHPFTNAPVPAQRCLIVDLENPDDVLDTSLKRLAGRALPVVGEDGDPIETCWLLHHPEGLYLRRRSDRAQLEAALEQVRPQLVCMGPIYKAHERLQGEGPEDAAEQTLRVLDELRTRFGFALVLEHHAPLGQSGQPREMRPFGSQRWSAWPEFGLTMKADGADVRNVGRYRLDRVAQGESVWPKTLHRGNPHLGEWSWTGRYETGTFGDGSPWPDDPGDRF